MGEPVEPSVPVGRVPHRDRIPNVVRQCPMSPKTAGVVIDNTPEHIAYYAHELAKCKEISVLSREDLGAGMYVFKITKDAVN